MLRYFKINTLFCLLFALFFNANASNIKKETNQKPDTVVYCFPKPVIYFQNKIKENSGLLYYKNLFWTFNDSGAKNFIYSYNVQERKIAQKFKVVNAENIDWEDITQDNESIYIGDFGNNFGSRDDLKIYKIPKNTINHENDGLLWAEIINFSYDDQKSFEHILKGTEFDCEAFFYLNEHLYLFTKDWINQKTGVYELPIVPGTYVAKKIDSFNIDGLITAADISPDGKTIAILGYKEYNPFMIISTNFDDLHFFSGKIVRFDMSCMHNVQTEGLTFTSNNLIYISSEKTKIPAQLVEVNLDDWKNIIY